MLFLQKLTKMDIASMDDSQFKLELIELQADLSRNLDDDAIRALFEELIRLDPDNQRYYEISANRTHNNNKAIRFLEMAVNKFPNDVYIINKLIDRKLDYCVEDCHPDKWKNELDTIKSLIEKSLSLYSLPDNDAYNQKYRYLGLLYKSQPQDRKKASKELSDILQEKAPYHPQTLSIMRKIESNDLNDNYFKAAIEYYVKADNSRNVEKSYIEYIGWACDNEVFDKVLTLFSEYEEGYVPSDYYRYIKASILMEREYLEDALAIFDSLSLDEDITRRKLTILNILGRVDEADSLFETSEYKESLQSHYYNVKKDFDKVKSYYENLSKEKEWLSVTEVVEYAYALLQCKEYDGVIRILKPYYDNPSLVDGAVIVNYLFARKKNNEDVAVKLRGKMLDNKYIDYSEFEKLGAYCVLGEKTNAYNCLEKVVKKEPMQKYSIVGWPVLAPFKNDEKFIKMLKPNWKKL